MAQELTLAGAIHLSAVVPAVAIGVIQLAAPKGTRPHKLLGWVWVLAMVAAAAGLGALMPGRFLAQLLF